MQANQRRLELKKLSRAFKPLVKAGKFRNTNAALIAYYQDQTGQTDFRTFTAWKKEGQSVRKGEQGFPIWGTPRHLGIPEGARVSELAQVAMMQGAEVQGPEWFPVCYLFHAGQVEALRPGSVHASASPEVAAMIDPTGALQSSGLLEVERRAA